MSESSFDSISQRPKLDYLENISDALKPFIIKKNEITIQEPIGRGMYGEVYKGTYNATDVGVKILTAEKWNQEIGRQFV